MRPAMGKRKYKINKPIVFFVVRFVSQSTSKRRCTCMDARKFNKLNSILRWMVNGQNYNNTYIFTYHSKSKSNVLYTHSIAGCRNHYFGIFPTVTHTIGMQLNFDNAIIVHTVHFLWGIREDSRQMCMRRKDDYWFKLV